MMDYCVWPYRLSLADLFCPHGMKNFVQLLSGGQLCAVERYSVSRISVASTCGGDVSSALFSSSSLSSSDTPTLPLATPETPLRSSLPFHHPSSNRRTSIIRHPHHQHGLLLYCYTKARGMARGRPRCSGGGRTRSGPCTLKC